MALSTITRPTSPRPAVRVAHQRRLPVVASRTRARVTTVPTVLFVRHGRSTSNTAGTLAGWMPGVFLDETGEAQAAAVGQRLAAAVLPVVEVVSSPLDRCVQTADLLAAPLPDHVARSIHEGLGECRYGAWTGRPIAELAREELWKVVQDRPSEARFPDSAAYPAESMVEMQDRALRA